MPGTAALSKGGDAGITSVSCASAGNCSPGGPYLVSRGDRQAFVVSQVDVKRNVELAAMLANLTARGIGRLFAEGGTMIHPHLTSRRSDLVQYLKSR